MLSVFVDISRTYRSVMQTNLNVRINYAKYLDIAADGEKLHKAYAYVIQKTNEAEDFATAMRCIGYETKFREAKIVRGKPSIYYTSVSMIMAMDIVRSARFVHTIVVGSNDPELLPVLEWVKEQDIKIILFAKNIPFALRQVCTSYIDIPPEIIEVKDA